MNLLTILLAVIAIQAVVVAIAAIWLASRASRRADDIVFTPGGPRRRDHVHAVRPDEVVEHGVVNRALRNRRPVSARELDRAPTLPPGFVITPGGPRHQSRVHAVQPHEAIVGGPGGLRILDTRAGTLRDLPAPEGDAANQVPEVGSGWITYAGWENGTGSSITSFSTTWTVPPPPANLGRQLIFLFSGIENHGANYGILQPVLQWGRSAAGGGPRWMVASWYVTNDGSALYSPLVPVNPGDTLVGVMTLTGVSPVAGGSPTFDYNCVFTGLPQTSLNVRGIGELLWCNQTLEAYRVTDCDHYPDTPSTSMASIAIRTGATNPALVWQPAADVTDCGQHTVVVSNSSTDGRVDLFYR